MSVAEASFLLIRTERTISELLISGPDIVSFGVKICCLQYRQAWRILLEESESGAEHWPALSPGDKDVGSRTRNLV